MGAVFSALNQGEGVTKGLRKVDKSEMTHKNPELRSTGAVGSTSRELFCALAGVLGADLFLIATLGKAPQKPPKPQSIQKKPPKTALEGKTWNIVRRPRLFLLVPFADLSLPPTGEPREQPDDLG